MGGRARPGAGNVFLNLPFHRLYERLFIALIMGVTALGRTPHCVLEVPDTGQERSRRIFALMRRCRISIHDLSLVRLTGQERLPRFNIPFELGLAVALSRGDSWYRFFLFEAERYRLSKTLSDLGGHDPEIHHGTAAGVLEGLLNWMGTPSGTPELALLEDLSSDLHRAVRRIKRLHRSDDPFRPHIFRQTVAVAADLAKAEGLIL